MRQPVFRAKDGVDVYAHVNDGGGWEQYGIRRVGTRRFEFVPISHTDPFGPIPSQPRYLTLEELEGGDL